MKSLLFFFNKVVKLILGGFVINGANLPIFPRFFLYCPLKRYNRMLVNLVDVPVYVPILHPDGGREGGLGRGYICGAQ